MSRISPREIYQKTPSKRGTEKERRYYAWLHGNCACVLTGNPIFEVAHTGGLAHGKGMGRKAALETCLPLIRDLHVIEERRRDLFWLEAGFPDYIAWAERLYDIFEKGDDPTALILDMNEGANREAIRNMLKGTWA